MIINMYDECFRMWNDRKAKVRHRQLNFNYWIEILEKMLEMFEYENVPEGIDVKYLDRFLYLNGTAGIAKAKRDKGYVAFVGGYCGDLNEYGIGNKYAGASVGESYEGYVNKDIVVGINNNLRSPRANIIDRYSGLLADIEESIEVGIINSRIVPLLQASNDKDVKQIEAIIEDVRKGKLCCISSKDASIFDENNALNVLNITDSNAIPKLQYYSRFYEDTLKRLWIESGIEITNKDKAAQVNEDELESFKQYSRITIEDMLKCREQMCDDFNSTFGGEWSVKLSHIFDNQVTEDDGVVQEGAEDDGSGVDGSVDTIDK